MNMKQQLLAATLLSLGVTMAPTAPRAAQMTLPQAYEIQNYMEYEEREPCQYYREYPEAMRPGTRCGGQEGPAAQTEIRILPVIARYEIYFDLNKATIRKDQMDTLNKLERELKTYNPSQITVTGHTDTSGPADYNQALSAKRALTVSNALTARNIPNFLLDKRAAGEDHLAIPTPDGTKLMANRRVVVEFRK